MINELHARTKEQMDATLEHTRQELATLRTGRANPRLVDHIKIDYYGSHQPLKNLASISAPEPRMLVVEPFDKTQIGAVEKAIQLADLGLNPTNDGQVIRLPIPELTEERRRDLVKIAHATVEEGKVTVRNVRRDANAELKLFAKEHDLSEDNMHREMENIQVMTDAHVTQLDEMLATKEKEILHG